MLLVLQPCIAARLHVARGAVLVHQCGQKFENRFGHIRQAGADTLYEPLTRLAGQAALRNGGGRGLHT